MNEAGSTTARSTIARTWSRVKALLTREDWTVIGWVLVMKALLFWLGFTALHVFDNKRLSTWHESLKIWSRWDGLNYLAIAEHGYTNGPRLVAYPLYPLLIRAMSYVTGDYLVSALLVSFIGSLFAAVLFRRLVRLDFSAAVARRAVWFFLIFPTSYFLHVTYNESVFLSLVFACFLSMRSNRWLLAGLFGGLAAMTRAHGLVLLPVMCVEAGQQLWRERKWRWQWLSILGVPLGYSVFLGVNYFVGGSAFAFMEVRRKIFRTHPTWPWVGIDQLINDLHRPANQAEIVAAAELLFVSIAFMCIIITWIELRRRPSYGTWMTVSWAGFAGLAFIQSAPRYCLSLFPIFILAGLVTRNRVCYAAITIWSLFYFTVFTILYARGWWAF